MHCTGVEEMHRGNIAHFRQDDQTAQSLEAHLFGVAKASFQNANKLGLGLAGELLGLLHDLGKYSSEFQSYIQSGVGLIEQDADDYVESQKYKGKVDHSTAGAQWVWESVSENKAIEKLMTQFLAMCLVSHHSGLIDCISPSGEDIFNRRMSKDDEKTHFNECLKKIPIEIKERINDIISNKSLIANFEQIFKKLILVEKDYQIEIEKNSFQKDIEFESRLRFKIGLLLRFLFSCLIDADRTDTADFEKIHNAEMRQWGRYANWSILSQRLENHLKSLSGNKSPINGYRKHISDACKNASQRKKGIFTLTVPTGGGKTLASLRFALQHALKYENSKQNEIDRIIYVIPYTSIIDQNADVTRKILEPENIPSVAGTIVLEHHSNLTDEKQTWKGKILSENWDAPVIFTTSVQFLEALFGDGTRDARRMHQLANSIIIFDEIQTLPIRCIHLFCNAINFLVDNCNCSVLLCTATQPLLNGVNMAKGALHFSQASEIVEDVSSLFKSLKRVDVIDKTTNNGWSQEDIFSLVRAELEDSGSCLVITNTTKSARSLYQLAKQEIPHTYHLSANMCPIHRMKTLKKIRNRLDVEPQLPVLCISTQVIEAGVDVDFGSVIRFQAGLDSIVQAAGRCNRHGRRDRGQVFVINPNNENLNKLNDIRKGKEITQRVFSEYSANPHLYGGDLLTPETMIQFFKYYFFDRSHEMVYPVGPNSVDGLDRDDSLFNMFSENSLAVAEYQRVNQKSPDIYLRQSFKTASEAFKSIDSSTRGIVVPYSKEGKKLIADFCSGIDLEKSSKLLKIAQRYSVNIYPHVFKELCEKSALHEIQEGTGVYYLKEQFYSLDFGLSIEPVVGLDFICT